MNFLILCLLFYSMCTPKPNPVQVMLSIAEIRIVIIHQCDHPTPICHLVYMLTYLCHFFCVESVIQDVSCLYHDHVTYFCDVCLYLDRVYLWISIDVCQQVICFSFLVVIFSLDFLFRPYPTMIRGSCAPICYRKDNLSRLYYVTSCFAYTCHTTPCCDLNVFFCTK